jgi:hypothetical protein
LRSIHAEIKNVLNDEKKKSQKSEEEKSTKQMRKKKGGEAYLDLSKISFISNVGNTSVLIAKEKKESSGDICS